jgi:hypothetical protein
MKPPSFAGKRFGTPKPRRALRAFVRMALAVAMVTLASLSPRAQAQQLPAVNLGDTSFLDRIAFPGWLAETINQGERDNKTLSNTGQPVPGITDVNSGVSLLHIAWVAPHPRFLGAWYGTEVVFTAAYVDTGGHGIGQGMGASAFAPIILQWPKHTLFGMPIYQRADLDVYTPTGHYSPGHPVNIGSNAWSLNPYYAVTLYPTKRFETSWRVHYLWNSTNHSPPVDTGDNTTQAGQAIHFNATASYEILKGLYVGANGYYLKQITDAHGNGLDLPNSRQQIGGIGPGAVYNRGKWFYWVNATTRSAPKT